MSSDRAAFFILDRAVTAGSSMYHFGRAALEWGVYRRRDLLERTVRSARRRRRDDASDVRDHLLATLKGSTREQMDVMLPSALAPILSEVRHDMYLRILSFEAAGTPTYLCSASPVELVAPIADVLNMSGGALATVAVTDEAGRYTGELDGPFCHGDGLVEVMEAEAARVGFDLDGCSGFGHAAADTAMLELVGVPVAVDPEPELAHIAAERGWETIEVSRPGAGRIVVAAGIATGATAAAVASVIWATRRPASHR